MVTKYSSIQNNEKTIPYSNLTPFPPQGKPLKRNETAVLQLGASSAALKGKGRCNVRHFQSLGLPVGKTFVQRMQQTDRRTQQRAKARLVEHVREKARIRRGKAFANHATTLESNEVSLYRKEGFSDHSYAKKPMAAAEE